MTSRTTGYDLDLSSLTVSQLRGELKKRGLTTKGVKKDLVKRLTGEKVSRTMDMGSVKHRPIKTKPDGANGSVEKKPAMVSEGKTEKHKHNAEEKRDRESLVLWRHPVRTLQYFCLESVCLLQSVTVRLWKRKRTVLAIVLAFLLSLAAYYTKGPHQKLVGSLEESCAWWGYWVGLGILSSVGLGTGLHTFLLYLLRKNKKRFVFSYFGSMGPHIASVTLAAYECMSVNFPEPPYPNEIICPDTAQTSISLWAIMSKVRIEAIMWGAGTAIGELPPYFMARAARLSGQEVEDEELEELEELIMERKQHPEELSVPEKLKLGVHNLVQKLGFCGILACASIPNPLFDLAGITCGHFLVPFWTFFGATLIGKAIIKMHIQKLFVIFIFSEKHVENVVNLISHIPKFGKSLQTPFQDWLKIQKSKLHNSSGKAVESGGSFLSWIFEKVIIVMVVYFILSIINSMAQSYHKRISKERQAKQ